MAAKKFKYFGVTIKSGYYLCSAPAAKLTVDYFCSMIAHHLKKQHGIDFDISGAYMVIGLDSKPKQ